MSDFLNVVILILFLALHISILFSLLSTFSLTSVFSYFISIIYYRGYPSRDTINVSPFQILVSMSPEKTSKPPFVAPSSVGAVFRARSDTRPPYRAVCHSVQLSRAVLYLSVLQPASPVPVRQLDCCSYARTCACTCMRTSRGVCPQAGTSQSRSLSLLPPLTHSVLVVAYAWCCSIHKPITETCGGTSATLYVGVENRRLAKRREYIKAISVFFIESLCESLIGNVSF